MQHLSLTRARNKMLNVVALGFPEKKEAQSRCYHLSKIGKDVVGLNQDACKSGL